MPKLIIMKGLPASGKSTKAKEIVGASGKTTIRLNKDLLREMLHYNNPNEIGYVFNGRQEDEVRKAQVELCRKFLFMGKNVIIDDTNLNSKTLESWVSLAKELKISHEIVDMTDVSIETCLLQDDLRRIRGDRFVGEHVIKNMALQWGLTKFEIDSVVICDIDGTIADTSKRQHYVSGEKKDWRNFFAEAINDDVRLSVLRDMVELKEKGKTIIFVSGRPDTYKQMTVDWFKKNGIDFHYTLIMRAGNDSREDSIIKEEILNKYFPDKSVIHKVFDDRPRVIRMWRANGLEVIDVGDGVEF